MRFLVLMTFFLFVTSNNQTNADAEKSLQVHNSARAEVGVADLIWSKELERDAKNYAEILASKDNGLVHSKSKNKQGENLYSWNGSSSLFSGIPLSDASYSWYSEIKDYKYGPLKEDSNFYKIGHYTQMIWKNTTHVGIASATSKTGKVYVVARYYPAGNYIGQYPY